MSKIYTQEQFVNFNETNKTILNMYISENEELKKEITRLQNENKCIKGTIKENKLQDMNFGNYRKRNY